MIKFLVVHLGTNVWLFFYQKNLDCYCNNAFASGIVFYSCCCVSWLTTTTGAYCVCHVCIKKFVLISRCIQDLSKVKIDVEQLRTLSELGIDVDFLTDIEDDLKHAQHDYGLAGALNHTYGLLAALEKEQRER